MITETNEIILVKNAFKNSTFKDNKFTRKAVLRTLLQAYIPTSTTSSNLLVKLGNIIAPARNRFHIDLATKMLEVFHKEPIKTDSKAVTLPATTSTPVNPTPSTPVATTNNTGGTTEQKTSATTPNVTTVSTPTVTTNPTSPAATAPKPLAAATTANNTTVAVINNATPSNPPQVAKNNPAEIKNATVAAVTTVNPSVSSTQPTDKKSDTPVTETEKELTQDELSQIFNLVNNDPHPVNPDGTFVRTLNAYFYYFPEDRYLVTFKAPADPHIKKIGFVDDYFLDLLKRFKENPFEVIRTLDDELVVPEVQVLMPHLNEEESLMVTKKLIEATTKNAENYRAVEHALSVIADHPSDAVKSPIRKYAFNTLMQEDEKAQNPRTNPWELPKILKKAMECKQHDTHARDQDRNAMIEDGVKWLNHYIKEKDFRAHQQVRIKPYYVLNALIDTATTSQVDVLANALVPYITATNPAGHAAKAKKDQRGYPHSNTLAETPLFRLFIEVAARTSKEASATLKTTLSKLPGYNTDLKTQNGDEFKPLETVCGFMISAINSQPTVKPHLAVGVPKQVINPRFFATRAADEKEMSMEDQLALILKQNGDAKFDFVNDSEIDLDAQWKPDKIVKENKLFTAQRYLKIARTADSETRMQHMRKISTLPDDKEGIKQHLFVQLHEMNRRELNAALSHEQGNNAPVHYMTPPVF